MSLNIGRNYVNFHNIAFSASEKVNSNAQASAAQNQPTTPVPTQQSPIQNTNPNLDLRTQITTQDELTKYSAIESALGKEEKENLKLLLATGRLLNNKSNDKSSTLDNLYAIMTTPRATGLDNVNVLKETVATIANPFVITQKFGDIPQNLTNKIIEEGFRGKALSENKTFEQIIKEQTELAQKYNKTASSTPTAISDGHTPDIINAKTINVEHSGCCVAASIEFNFASQYPAEFARFVAGLTSPNVSVNKKINMKNLNEKSLDSIWLLNAFKIPYKMQDFDKANIVLAPDKNAILRAQIQNSYKDKNERSIVDVLMQSTFMNVGSQQTYDSLTDISQSELNQNDNGLGEFEKTFVESVVEDKNTTSVTFQDLDENGVLKGYLIKPEVMMKHIQDSIKDGKGVIVGCTDLDANNKIINGHEVTIIGIAKDKKGGLNFIYNDTDDDIASYATCPVELMLPRIHHAGIPAEVLKDEPAEQESWVQGLKDFQEARKSQVNTPKTPAIQNVTNPVSAQNPNTQPQIIQPVVMYNGVPSNTPVKKA